MNDKGQLWSEWMSGIVAIMAVTIIYIILEQVYTASIRPIGINLGTNATNLGYIDTAWQIFLIPVGIAVFYGIVSVGRIQKRMSGVV